MLGEVTHAFESILERLSARMHSPAEVSLTAINHATTMGCRAGIIAAVTIVVRAAVVAQRRRCPPATRPACVQVVELRAYIPTVPELLDELGARVAAVCDQYEVRRPGASRTHPCDSVRGATLLAGCMVARCTVERDRRSTHR